MFPLDKKKRAKLPSMMQQAYRLYFQMFYGFLVFVGLGIWCDKHFLTTPLFSLVGFLFTLVYAVYSYYKFMRQYNEESDKS